MVILTTCVSREKVYLHAVETLRQSLITKLIAYNDVFFCKLVKQGQAYRAAYVDNLQVTNFKEWHDHPTAAPMRQYDAIWMHIKYTELYESIPDSDTVAQTDYDRGLTLQEQMDQLSIAMNKYLAGISAKEADGRWFISSVYSKLARCWVCGSRVSFGCS